MDFSETKNTQRIKKASAKTSKYINKLLLTFFKTFFTLIMICLVFLIAAGIGAFMGIIDNTPEINVESIIPMNYKTTIYDNSGNIMDTLVMAGSNREEVTYEELPQDLINAFVAIEDERFWEHNGIDAKSIIRAIWGVLTNNSSSGGGSTITQQLIKNNVFDGGHESSRGATLERKFQEQYLAIQLEKVMDKKLILTSYLNTINLGNNCLGVKVASRKYFGKDVSELTLSECTVIAGITQNPSKLNPISGRTRNEEKRKVILQYMFEQGYITKEQQEEALADPVYDRITNINTASEGTSAYSYYTDVVITQVINDLIDKYGYSETQAHNLLYSGGLSIYTCQDSEIQNIIDDEIENPDNYVETKYSLDYRLTIKDDDGNYSNYNEKHILKWHKEVLKDNFSGLYNSEDEINEDIENYKEYLMSDYDTVVGEKIYPCMEPQVSFVLIDQSNGQVKGISGGRGTKQSSLSLNRATDSLRQPGSTFKVLSSFIPAIDSCGATLGSVYYDTPYTVLNKTFKNWYSSGYFGWSNIRDGIIYSMNIVAIRCLMETVTPELGVEYCQKFGITSLSSKDYNAATALGGVTDGVSNLELTSAYSAIANGGIHVNPVFYTKVVDHNGKILLETETESTRVIKETTSFLVTDAMADSMEYNHIYSREGVTVSSTSSSAHLDSMSCAGKSGTTTNNHDIWFVGFTPYYTAGVWAGFDNNESTLDGQTSFHKKIWKNIMDRVHENLEDTGFTTPEGIVSAEICRKSGKLAIPGVCDCDERGSSVYTEYFDADSVPTEFCDHHKKVTVCTDSNELASDYCINTTEKIVMIVPDTETNALNVNDDVDISMLDYTTDDTYFTISSDECHLHSKKENSNTYITPFDSIDDNDNYISPFISDNNTGPVSSSEENSTSPIKYYYYR